MCVCVCVCCVCVCTRVHAWVCGCVWCVYVCAFVHICLSLYICVVCICTHGCPLVCIHSILYVYVILSIYVLILLVESKHPEKQQQAQWLLSSLLTHKHRLQQLGRAPSTFRIGLSGPPGAGKSTFIETFGQMLTKEGNKLAVLVSLHMLTLV